MTQSHQTYLNAVTGAFGYTGRYIARRLLSQGQGVITLTGHPERQNPFGDRVKVFPFNFDRPEALARSLEGVSTLYNTYWVRFSHGGVSFERAVANTKILIRAAKSAGVKRLVHVSITNPSLDSPLPYFRGKAELESFIRESGLSYAILRPTVIFGREDILLNNIAYLLRRFPVFAIPGSGAYQLQPVYVEDLAEMAVQVGMDTDDSVIDAVGPEIFTFTELVRVIQRSVGSRARLIHVHPSLALFLSRLLGLLVRDVVLTRDEVRGLAANLLVTGSPPVGKTSFADWARQHGSSLGKGYASELNRHYQLKTYP